jgi:hypothetical protein
VAADSAAAVARLPSAAVVEWPAAVRAAAVVDRPAVAIANPAS